MANRRWRILIILENMSSSNCATALAVSISPIVNFTFTQKWPLVGSGQRLSVTLWRRSCNQGVSLNCNFHGCYLLAMCELWRRKKKSSAVVSSRPDDVAQKCKDMNVQDVWWIYVGVTGSHRNMVYWAIISDAKCEHAQEPHCLVQKAGRQQDADCF